MNRRTLLASSLAASALAGSRPLDPMAAKDEGESSAREYYELRLYHLRRGAMQKLTEDFLKDALLPALRRLAIGPVGVFNVLIGPASPTLYVLIPHRSLESFSLQHTRLAADGEFAKAGAALINAPASDPSYVRAESSLMVAFEGMPRVEVPPAAVERRHRICELRTYESHSKKANLKKIEMFNRGEIAVFRRTGLRPVFFGETLVGTRLPNLTYMLTFDDLAAREKNWAAFVADAEWKKLSVTPGYTDAEIVSNISNVLLTPTAYSEI